MGAWKEEVVPGRSTPVLGAIPPGVLSDPWFRRLFSNASRADLSLASAPGGAVIGHSAVVRTTGPPESVVLSP
jgi:hypothetical protein